MWYEKWKVNKKQRRRVFHWSLNHFALHTPPKLTIYYYYWHWNLFFSFFYLFISLLELLEKLLVSNSTCVVQLWYIEVYHLNSKAQVSRELMLDSYQLSFSNFSRLFNNFFFILLLSAVSSFGRGCFIFYFLMLNLPIFDNVYYRWGYS